MSKMILIACALPCGLILDGMSGPVQLNGKNTAMIPGAPGLTRVDENEWAYLSAAYGSHSAFENNAIFATGSDKVTDIVDMADELKDEKTGFEGMDPDNPAPKLEPADRVKLEQNKQVAANSGPRKAPVGKGSKAAAIELAASAGA